MLNLDHVIFYVFLLCSSDSVSNSGSIQTIKRASNIRVQQITTGPTFKAWERRKVTEVYKYWVPHVSEPGLEGIKRSRMNVDVFAGAPHRSPGTEWVETGEENGEGPSS